MGRWIRRSASAVLAIGLLTATANPAQAVDRARTRLRLQAAPSASSAGEPVTLTATVAFALSGEQTPTGSVDFGALNGSSPRQLGSAPVTGCSLATRRCTATLVTTELPEGADVVGARYSGDSTFKPSKGFTSATVTAQGAPTLTSATAGDGQVALQWSAPTTGGPVTSYSVYRSETSGVQGPLLVSGVTDLFYTDTSAVNDTTYSYVVTAVNGADESAPSNELSARPPSSVAAASPCSASEPCASPTVTSEDGSTSLQASSDASAGFQTLTVQVGGVPDLQCTLPGSGAVVAEYHTTAPDAPKTADYTTFGAAATFANNFYAMHTDISGCYGSPDAFNGWSPTSPGDPWATGPYTYGAAPFNPATGLYEAFLGSCANHGGYQPCFTNINGGTYNTTQVRSPASANDPRVSH